MIKVIRKKLEIAAKYIDVNNPKFELNFLYIDEENLVSTNTRALAVVKHDGKLEGNTHTFIHKSVVDLALKQTKAVKFELDTNSIHCIDKDGAELIKISKEHDFFDGFKYPEYERIIPKYIENKHAFIHSSSISGILALNKTLVDDRYIPSFADKKDYLFDGGFVGINEPNMPIVISDKYEVMRTVIMPIVTEFPIFREEESA